LTNIVPCSEIDWTTIAKPAPNEDARKNYIAGLAWALTVVNMKQPEIMANVLKRHGEIVSRDDAFANGVASSIIMRHDTTPNAQFVQDYLNYQPKDQRAADYWETQIRQPGLKAVNEWYPVLKERQLLGQVFQYHPLSSFPNIG
jgi:hypothetical protein